MSEFYHKFRHLIALNIFNKKSPFDVYVWQNEACPWYSLTFHDNFYLLYFKKILYWYLIGERSLRALVRQRLRLIPTLVWFKYQPYFLDLIIDEKLNIPLWTMNGRIARKLGVKDQISSECNLRERSFEEKNVTPLTFTVISDFHYPRYLLKLLQQLVENSVPAMSCPHVCLSLTI